VLPVFSFRTVWHTSRLAEISLLFGIVIQPQ
jgi:hypothetical protein